MANNGTQFVPPTWDTSKVLVGVGYLMTSAIGCALPGDIDLGDFSKWQAALPSPGWGYVGSTDQGLSVELNPNMNQIQIEESPIPVATMMQTATFTISTSLAESSLDKINMAYGNGGTKTVTAPGTGQPGKTILKLSSSFPVMQAAVLGKNELGFPRIFYVPKCNSAGQVTTAWRRAADKRMYPLTLNALCDLSEIQIIDITAAGT
jgi:hypothetical protein